MRISNLIPYVIIFLLISCSSVNRNLSKNIQQKSGVYNSSEQTEIFSEALSFLKKARDKNKDKEFLWSLKYTIDIQTSVELPDEEYKHNKIFISSIISNYELKIISHFLNEVGKHNFFEAKKYYSKIIDEDKSKYQLHHIIAKFQSKIGNVNESYYSLNVALNSPNPKSAIEKLIYRTKCLNMLKFHAARITNHRFYLNQIENILPISKFDLDYILFDLINTGKPVIAAQLLLDFPQEKLPLSYIKLALNKILRNTEKISIIDNIVKSILRKRNLNLKKEVEEFVNIISQNKLTLSAQYISKYINRDIQLSDSAYYKIGSLIFYHDKKEIIRIWKIPYKSFLREDYFAKNLYANTLIFEGKLDYAKEELYEIIKLFPDSVPSRNLFLHCLIYEYNLDSISAFLTQTKETTSDSIFDLNFGELEKKINYAINNNFYLWQNDSNHIFYAHNKDGYIWLYTEYLEYSGSYLFFNNDGDERIWTSEDKKEYLSDKNFNYLNVSRWKNNEGEYVYSEFSDGRTYYYDKSLKWLHIYSYESKNNGLIFVKADESKEYFYDSNFVYLNIYSFSTVNGEKYFAKIKDIRTDLFDSEWNYLNISIFDIQGYKPIYAYVSSSSVSLMFQNDNGSFEFLGTRFIKDENGEVIIEDGFETIKHYYDRYGNFLNYSTWEESGSIKSITVWKNGNCQTYYSGMSDLSECSIYDKIMDNIYLSKKYLNIKISNLAGELVPSSTNTPIKIFESIEASIKKRKQEEMYLAIANALNAFSESLNQSSNYKSYSNYTYQSPTKSYYTPTYNFNVVKPKTQPINSYSTGSRLYSRDGTYLGNLNSNKYDPNSVSNPYGQYGSKYSSTSINNPYSTYGSPYSLNSANTKYGKGLILLSKDGEYLGNVNKNIYDMNSINNPYGKYGSKFSSTSINNPFSKFGNKYGSDYTPNIFKIIE